MKTYYRQLADIATHTLLHVYMASVGKAKPSVKHFNERATRYLSRFRYSEQYQLTHSVINELQSTGRQKGYDLEKSLESLLQSVTPKNKNCTGRFAHLIYDIELTTGVKITTQSHAVFPSSDATTIGFVPDTVSTVCFDAESGSLVKAIPLTIIGNIDVAGRVVSAINSTEYFVVSTPVTGRRGLDCQISKRE